MILIRRVIGNSMFPLFRQGMLVCAIRFIRPRVGDIVIATYGKMEILKRIKAIGADGYFLLGDNAAQSSDSRTYGWFNPQSIKGVVIRKLIR